MAKWRHIAESIEALEGLALQDDFVAELEQRRARLASPQPGIHFYTPTFKSFQTSEIKGCGRNAWPAISITGPDCKLQCDHCKTKILEPMIAARTPEQLWLTVEGLITGGAQGMLLTGGSNHRNEVEYDPYYPVVRRMRFDVSGRLVDYGVDKRTLNEVIQSGKPFQTSGCPGRQDDVSACNRPYGDSMPADIRLFPFALVTGDVDRVRRQMQDEDICVLK